jgi:hypothetical protein
VRALIAIFVSALAVCGQASVCSANPHRLNSFERSAPLVQPISHASSVLNLHHGPISIRPVTAAPADGKSFYNEFSNSITLEDDSHQGQASIENRDNAPSSPK